MNRKVTVVGGAGNVGATVARAIANRELADVVVIDIAETKAQGIALDILQACPIEGSDARAVVWRAEGEVFTGGADVNMFVGLTGEQVERELDLVAMPRKLEVMSVPTLAVVGGLCLTAGFELSLEDVQELITRAKEVDHLHRGGDSHSAKFF